MYMGVYVDVDGSLRGIGVCVCVCVCTRPASSPQH